MTIYSLILGNLVVSQIVSPNTAYFCALHCISFVCLSLSLLITHNLISKVVTASPNLDFLQEYVGILCTFPLPSSTTQTMKIEFEITLSLLISSVLVDIISQLIYMDLSHGLKFVILFLIDILNYISTKFYNILHNNLTYDLLDLFQCIYYLITV